ncbi:inverse autotransporter adhesin IatC [Escherichia coli]
MVGKAHGNGDRRGDNTICGLGDRLRRLTAGICLITQTIFPVMAAAPTHINPAHSNTAASLILPNVKTIPYTLGALESPPTVAARFGITVDELRRLNQFRTFARGFDHVRQGDEIDVPLINSYSPEARNLKAMQMERDGKDPQMQVAEVAQQSGTLLARDMDSEQAASMARGWVASSASAQATDWLSRWGTARVSLGVDEDFSLKSSSFEFLHPWYETPDNLVFSQHTLHRTDDRTQTNHGIGWRYFTPSWMSGVNMFIDHDLTRYHTRTGMGVEYWRNYLKLSGNGYLRLSNWRSAPELDNDYEARPANGWDLRAEGWLPAWPQLGGKLVYEQYYGDEVALFGKDERQNDPHAITAGLSYTPVPLISFSAEQRQGKQGENDTRIGMELTLQPGHSLQKQLDPAEVAARRSLVGSRYDLVDRNNNIVLEYRKKELVRLTLTDPLKGKPGEVKSLVSSLQTKYALKGYDIEAASLQSAGGKVAVSGKDIQVTIPPYRFTAMPETDNTYPIAVTAEDSKGNFSRREESMVVVEKPTLSLTDSTLSVDQQILLADGKSTSTLTYTARDSSGKPIPGMTLKTQAKGLQDFALSEWKDNGNGTYTQIVTAGKTSGALSLMPQFNGDDIAKTPALIAIVANTASRADSTIETDQDNYVAGKPIVVKVTLRDDNGNGVTGRKELLKQAVKVDNTKADAVSAWTEESEGIYKASYTAHLIGDKLTAQLTMPGWQTKHSDAFSIAGDKDTAKIAAMQITANNAVARRDHNTVAVTVRDVHQNLLQGQNVTFTVVNGAAVFADPNGGIVTTDKDGIASVNLASDQAVNSLIKAETNGSSQSVEVSFITGDISQLTSTIKTDDVSYTAGGKIKVSVTLMDEQKNLVKGMASLLAGSGVVEVSGTDKNETGNWSEESDGVYTTTRTAKIAGDRHYATLKLSTWSSAQQSDAYAIRESGAVLAYSSIVTDKTTYTAGGAIKVTVTLKDSFENLVGGQRDAINQAIQLPNTKAESIAWNEDQKGIYTATYTALLPGTGLKAQLQMSGWASALTSNDYSISGDAASAQIVAMQVTTGNPDVLANGSDRHTVNVRVEDQFGNVLPEQTVTFTVTKGAAVFANAGQSADIRTDAHGMAEVDLSSTVADASTVEAKVNQSSDSKTVNFVADVSTAQVAELVVTQVAELVVTQDGSVADGSTANTLRVKVTDAFGNALAGQTVSVTAGNGATVAPVVTTQPDGTVEISVTSQTAGTSAVTASINNSSQSRNVTFIADVRTAKIADLVVIKDGSEADGSTANTLQVRVTDAFGNALNGQTVSVLADNGATTAPMVTTQPDGTVEISVTSQTAGVSTVTASINSSSLIRNVTFVADVRTAQIASLEVMQDNAIADGAMANTLRVRVTDAFGNALAGQTVSVLADNSATTAPTVITEPDGTVEISVTSQTAGTSTVTASINSSSLSRNVTFVADVRTAQIAVLEVTQDYAVADGSTANTLRVKVTDAFGNALAGQTVSVMADNGATVAPTAITGPDGTVEISVTSQTAGISTVTATINSSSQSRDVTFIADASTAQIADLVVIKDGSEADGSTENTLRVRVTDAFGNTLGGQTVSVTADNSATVTPTVITEPDGTVEISVTSQTAGTSVVTASINNSSQSRNVTFIADVRTAKIADLEVIKDGSEADGSTANTLRARVTDAFGNALAGQTVSVLADNGATVALTETTKPDGTAEISVTSQTAGVSAVTVSINNSSQSRNVTFIADVRTAQIAELVVIKDGSEADGSTANTLRVRVTDAFGNALAGQTVSVLADNGATVAPTVTTQPDGTVEISVTSQTAGTSTVTASINSSSQSRNVTFIADVSTAQIASLEVTQDNAVADGATANTLRVRVTDAFGNALAGQTVSVLAGNGATTAPTVTTQPDGTVEISVTSQTAGISAVTASINNSSQSRNVTFIADVRTAKIADLVVTRDNSVADGAMANTLQVKVTDAFGNTLAGQTVSVMADNSATVSPTVTTEPDGTVEISVTSQTAGVSAVTASINNSSLSQSVKFIADVRTAQIADLVVIKDGSEADGSTANTLQVRVTDAFGNALAGQTVSVTADNSAMVASTVITGPDGTVEISVTSQIAGTSAVTASINNSSLSRNVTFVADVSTAQIAVLEVTQDNTVADGATANTLQVKVTDAFGNALAGQTVSVMADNGATVAPTMTTKPDGTVEISVTSQTAGTSAVTATINSSSQSRNVTFVADVRTAKIADLVVSQDNAVADGSTANTLRARVTDAFGNALTGQTVSVLAGNGATTAPTVTTQPDGTVEISVTSQTAGISAVTATINNSTASQNVTFVADVRTAKIADLVVIKDGSEADGSTANTLQVRVTDAFGNALAGQTVSVLADNGATVAPTVTTQPDGTVEISVTSQTAGVSAVTATINSSTQSQNVTFIADVRTAKIADLVVIKDGSEADGSTANTLRARVTDAFGNALAGQAVSVMAGNSATVTPTVTTQSDGTVEFSVTSQTAGTSTVTASINSSSLSRDVTFIADVSTAQIASLEVTQDNSVADGAMANTLRARVTDAFGNALAGQTVSVTAGNGATVAPTVTTQPDGTVEISVTSQTAGTSTVTASINSSSLSRTVTFIADVRTAQIADLVVTRDNAVADGSTANTLQARVTDAFGNALAGQTVSVLADNSATVAPTVTTQPDGTVEIFVTSQTAGTSAVTASINSSSQSRDVTFIADVRTAKIADLVVTWDNSVADGAMANTLQVKVTDANGNTLAGQTVSVLADNGATVAPTVTTQPDGTVEISVTSQTAGISAVTASINSSSLSRNVTFIADVRTAKIAELEVIRDNAVADGSTANTLQVKVTDANGNTLAGQTVSVLAGNSATVAPTMTTKPDGTVEISVTSQTAGTSTVTASINNSSQSQNVTFVPGDASQLTSIVETNKSNYTVGETITITVTLRDAFDNLVTGAASQLAADGVLTVAGTDPSEMGSWVESGGVYTTTRMATIASTNQHANLQLQTWSDGVTSDRYDIQSGSPAQATSTIATDKNAYTAGDTITVAVTLKDAHGNLVEGGESLLSGDNVIVEGAVRSGGWSENAGVYTATWSAQMAGDSHHATLKLSEWGSSKQSESYSIHSGAPVQANSAIRTDKSAYIAGEPLTVTITLRDEFGNPALGLTSEVIESYIDSFAVGGATPDSMRWVEQNNGEYTIVWTAWVADENLVASLKLKTWATEIKSSLYGIQPGAAAKTQSTIVADKTIYIAGDSITVTVVLKDAQGNFITDGVVQLNEENVQVRNADPIQGNNWVYNGNGQYQRQYMAHFAEANLNAQLKMAGWSDANYSNNYTIKPGEVSPLGSQLRIREVLVVEGADLPVSALLVDDFGNPVDNGLDLLDDAVYLQNVEKKEGEKWRYVGDGIYERTYMAYQEGENLTSFMEIKGWRIYGQPSYTILPFVEVELLSVNGVKFRATDGFPETGFDGAKFTLLLTHNMKNTDYNWTAGIYGINVDSNGEVTLSVLIRSEVTITGKPKNGKGNDVVFKFKIKKWFTSLGATSSNT